MIYHCDQLASSSMFIQHLSGQNKILYNSLTKIWLVVWNIFCSYIGNVIIPTDFHIFQIVWHHQPEMHCCLFNLPSSSIFAILLPIASGFCLNSKYSRLWDHALAPAHNITQYHTVSHNYKITILAASPDRLHTTIIWECQKFIGSSVIRPDYLNWLMVSLTDM